MAITDENGFELFDHDPVMGRTIWSYFDGEKTHYRIDYQVDQLVKENEYHRNNSSSGWQGEWHRIASVPLNIMYASGLHEAINQGDDKFASKFLNDGDNRAWRTKEGNV